MHGREGIVRECVIQTGTATRTTAGTVGLLSDSGAAAMSRPFGRWPYGRAAARSGGPHPPVGGTRRHAAPMAAPAKTGPGPSPVPGILSPRKITVKGAPCGRVFDGTPRHP